MIKQLKFPSWSYWVILLTLALILFFLKLNMPLTDGDSAFYGTIARNIVSTGEWQTLHFENMDFVDKPPLSIWPIAVSYYLFGVHDWSTKLWNALISVFCILLTYIITKEFGKPKAAFWSGIILLTSLMMFYSGQVPQQDIPVVFFNLVGFWGFLRFFKTKNVIYFYLIWISMGCNTLTRGIPGVVFIAGTIILYLILRKILKFPKIKMFKNPKDCIIHFMGGIVAFFVFGVLWYVLEYIKRGPDFLDVFLGSGLTRFFTQSMDGSKQAPSFLVEFPLLIACLIPWSGYLWYVLKLGWKDRRENDGFFLFLLSWFVVTFAMTLVIKWRVIRYLLPCLPPLAIIIGHIVINVLEDSAGSSQDFSQEASRFAAIFNLVLVIPIILGIIYYLIRSNTVKVEYLPVVLPFFIVFFSGMTLFSIFAFCKKYSPAIYSQLILTVLAYVLLLNLISSSMKYINPWPQMISKLNDVRQPGEMVFYDSDESNPFIDFYLGEHPLKTEGTVEFNNLIQERVSKNSTRFFVVTNNLTDPADIQRKIAVPANVERLDTAPQGQSLFRVTLK